MIEWTRRRSFVGGESVASLHSGGGRLADLFFCVGERGFNTSVFKEKSGSLRVGQWRKSVTTKVGWIHTDELVDRTTVLSKDEREQRDATVSWFFDQLSENVGRRQEVDDVRDA